MALPVSSKAVEQQGNALFRAGVCSMNGCRESMEDSHAIVLSDTFGLFSVFDGHAGSACSNFCAEEFPLHISNRFPLTDERLSDLCYKIDDKYIKTLASNPLSEASDAGSTASFFVAHPLPNGRFDLQIANIGDARVLIADAINGSCVFSTHDHKPNDSEELLRIKSAGGRVKVGKINSLLSVSRAIGDLDFKSNRRRSPIDQMVIPIPSLYHFEATSEHFALVVCDGIVESGFDNNQVCEFAHHRLLSGDEPAQVAAALCEEALKRGSKDNMTACLVQFKDGSSLSSCGTQFLPGPFFYKSTMQFWQTYSAMATQSSVNMGACMEMRYDFIKRCLADLQAWEGEGRVVEEKRMQEELQQYGDGPDAALENDQRQQWFDNLVERWQVEAFGEDFDSDPDP